MKFEDSSLYLEFRDIAYGPDLPIAEHITAKVHTESDDISVMKVISIDTIRDYELAFSEVKMLTCMVGAGTYLKRIYQNRNHLEVSITRLPVDPNSGEVIESAAPIEERYVAVLREDISSPVIEARMNVDLEEEVLNRADVLSITIQLIDKNVYEMRLRTVGGSYRNVSNEELIKGILTVEANATKLEKQYRCRGVDFYPASNKKKQNYVVVPHGTKLTSFPEYIQERCGGVYSTGLGYFYQDHTWFVYPLYDTTRFESVKDTLIVINVPSRTYPGLNKTYKNPSGNLTVLSTGDTEFSDKSDQNDLNLGNGVRFTDASKYLEGFVIVKGNKAMVDRSKNVTEVVVEGRKDGLNYVPVSEIPAGSNVFVQYSALAQREISVVQTTWENGKLDLLYPGMPVKFMYMDKDEVVEVPGTLLKVHAYTHGLEKAMFNVKFNTNIVMAIGLNRSPTLNSP